MNLKLKSNDADQLFHAMSLLRSQEEYYNFFEDLCTITELQALMHRFAVAKMLYEGKTYLDVGEKTGASTATISRISKCLSYGADGYNVILERIKKGE